MSPSGSKGYDSGQEAKRLVAAEVTKCEEAPHKQSTLDTSVSRYKDYTGFKHLSKALIHTILKYQRQADRLAR